MLLTIVLPFEINEFKLLIALLISSLAVFVTNELIAFLRAVILSEILADVVFAKLTAFAFLSSSVRVLKLAAV